MRLLLLSQPLQSKADLFDEIVSGLPSIGGDPVSVSILPELTAHRGELLSQSTQQGTPVHAASFIRGKRIVLEAALLNDENNFRLILVHELFHFAWPRMSNHARREYTALLAYEFDRHARAELGESSYVRKRMALADNRHWKDYVCESFCDTAAYLYAGVESHPAFRLGNRWRQIRSNWFRNNYGR